MSTYQSKHTRTGRFLEVVLLSLLKEEDLYGYSLMEKIKDFGFNEDTPNLSTLYRRLNRMEDEGMVLSFWTNSEQGPKQKHYQITDKGIRELDIWIKVIKSRRKHIDLIIEKYESTQ